LLVDPQVTAAVLVALPEELPVNEVLELHGKLKSQVRVETALIVLNHFVSPRFNAANENAIDSNVASMIRAHRHASEYSAACLARLQSTGCDTVTIPKRFVSQFGRSALEALAMGF
jgi:hypothetical protein